MNKSKSKISSYAKEEDKSKSKPKLSLDDIIIPLAILEDYDEMKSHGE